MDKKSRFKIIRSHKIVDKEDDIVATNKSEMTKSEIKKDSRFKITKIPNNKENKNQITKKGRFTITKIPKTEEHQRPTEAGRKFVKCLKEYDEENKPKTHVEAYNKNKNKNKEDYMINL